MPKWRNWYTRCVQGAVLQGLRVRIPPSAFSLGKGFEGIPPSAPIPQYFRIPQPGSFKPMNAPTPAIIFSNKTAMKYLFTILLATFLIYTPTLKNNFVNLDDNSHLLDNYSIRALDVPHVQQIFTTTVDKVYAPLTFLSFAVEYHFFKYTPFIYHWNNLLLHLAVTSLVFYFALQLGLPLRAALIGGLLFGIHPMHVESVAWVTERKDVLYAFFYMLSLCCYVHYLSTRDRAVYFATIAFGILSILAKPMALSLPLIMLVCDWLTKRKIDRWMIIDKIPHFIYIVAIAWITYSLNARVPGHDVHSGVAIWIWTCVFYIHKFFLPLVLVPMYALPQPISLANPHYWGALVLFTSLIGILIVLRKERWVWFTALFYFFSMFFLFRYDNAVDKNIVADRFIYLPCLGICFLIGYALDRLFLKIGDNKKSNTNILSFVLIVMALFLGGKTFVQTQIWRASIPFWNHELKYYPDNALAYGNRGEAYSDIGKMDLAMADFNQSLKVDPTYAESYNSRGQVYGMSGKIDAALADFRKTIELQPHFDEAYNNIGIIYAMQKDMKQAAAFFKKALEIDPHNPEARNNYNMAIKLLKN
jgi:hypothetical protein